MEPILTIDNLNSFGGNMLRQGDKSQLKYRLRDVGNKNLSISSKPCEIKMYGRNYTTVVYETTATVSSDNTVSFTIDNVLPKGTFYLEFTVGDYIFPTDHREFFEITPSGKGMESNIIEIVGVDAVVRKAVDLINQDPSLIIDEDKLVTDIISNTGIGSINEYYKAFNDLKPKAEQSITKSAEALTKSQNALNVANGIDAKATNALSLSKSADTLSKSVQEQFNQVVIDGDSSVEAAQARIDASGQTNATLKARLDKEHNEVTAQLAQTMTQTEFDSWVATLLDGGPSIFMDSLAQLQSTYPAGAVGIALVRETDPAKIYAWDGGTWKSFGDYQGLVPKDGSVRPEKTTFFDVSTNLWNESTALTNTSITTSGEVITETGRLLGQLIPVSAGETISYDGSFVRVSYHTKSGTFISRTGVGGSSSFNVPIVADIGFMRFSPPIQIATSFMANRGSVLLPHEKGYIKLKQELLPESDSVNELQVLNIVSSKLLPLERDISKVTTKENMLKVESDGDFTFFLKIAEGEYAAHRFKRDAVEDFIKKYEESIYTKEKSTTLANYDWQNESDMIGTAPGQITNNQYTATVGKKINFNFDGNQITMRYPSRYDGGMWRATIDGVFVKNISTRSTATSIVTREEIIATGLESGLHTLTIEFMGNDPSNPATTVDLVTPTTPRGWISADASTPDDARKTFKVVKISENITKRFDLTSGFSNKEFAFEVEKAKDEGSQWFPAHFGIGTTNRGATGLQYLLVDGEEVDITKSSVGFINFEKAEFVQVMECKRSDDTDIRAIVKLIMSVDGARLTQKTEIEFLKDTFVRNAYVFMLPALNTYLSQIKSNSAQRIYANTTDLGTNEYFDASATHFTATSDAVDMSDYYLTLGITHLSKPLDSTYLQHRSDGTLQKLYPKTLSQYQAVAGEILQYDGFWEVGKTKGANRVYG